jgi:peptide/nickel transport system substrate-binding protein
MGTMSRAIQRGLRRGWAIAGLCVLAAGPLPASAAMLRYAGAAPPLTFDPHGTNDFATVAVLREVYDSLVSLDDDMQSVPGLATSWEGEGDTTWRFHLRQGVKFHDGSTLTAGDVAFSILRERGSGYYSSLFGGITDVKVVDPATIDVISRAPDPILPSKMARLFVMSRSWSLAHDLQTIPNLGAKGSEAYSVRHANGTGPYVLTTQDPGVRTVLDHFPGYWGKATGNVTEATYLPIGEAATRVAALLSGQVDMVIDVPLNDITRVKNTPGFALHQVPQMLWMQLEMDGTRDAALDVWDKFGKPLEANPFKDTRVRMAIAQAINVPLIIDRVLRGNARVVGIPALPGTGGYDAALDKHWPFDPDHAGALLAEAGYPNGFVTQLNCPTERYPSAEDVCRAVASMLGRIGIDVRVNNMVWPEFARMLVNGPNSSFHLIGVASSWDAQDAFVSEMMTRNPKAGEGFFNWALWHNAQLDKVARELQVTFDPAKRKELYDQGLTIGRDDVYAAFLFQPLLSWGSIDKVSGTVRSDSTVVLQNVVVK